MDSISNFDVIIIGGSYSGLSAAMALGRSMKKVLILDSGKPCNSQTPHSHNFITQDGRTPAEIAGLAREQVEAYDSVQMNKDEVVEVIKTDNGFKVKTASGGIFNCRKLIVATGIKDLLPEIEGLRQCWGITVVHCPYCHGYELKGVVTGILDNGDSAMHYAMLLKNLTDKLTIFTNGQSLFTDEQRLKLHRNNVVINENEIQSFEHEQGKLQAIRFRNGESKPLDALYTRPPFRQHSSIAESLGCAFTEQGHIQVNQFQQTTVAGVFACGDNASMMRSVANAVAAGNLAGAMVNREMSEEDFNR